MLITAALNVYSASKGMSAEGKPHAMFYLCASYRLIFYLHLQVLFLLPVCLDWVFTVLPT